ncbi:hypothetical protein HYX18_00095, partial [Candidatus Woesearchaeota archaeon]|nr:hypothetical protein [Candidatus Woesearchaeota archaeon]
MFRKYAIIGLLGLTIALYGIFSAIYLDNIFWYSYFAIGATIFLSYVTYHITNKSLIKKFEKDKFDVIKKYFYYVVIGISIEVIFNYFLDLWSYPKYSLYDNIVNVFIIGYPFALFLLYESFLIINKKFNFVSSIIIGTILNTFLNELPNTFVHEWVYNIPNLNLEILNINIFVFF